MKNSNRPQFLPRENPFRVSQVERIPFIFKDCEDFDALWLRFEESGCRGMIVGPHGSGKTTLLEQFGDWILKQGIEITRIGFNEEKRQLSKEDRARLRSANGIVLVDGVEQLSALSWAHLKSLSRHRTGLIGTSHKDFRLPTIYRTETSLLLLRELSMTLGVGEALPVKTELSKVYQRFDGNIRDIFRHFYDQLS